MRTVYRLRFVLGSLLLTVPALAAAPPPTGAVTAFVHVNVIPMDRERVLRDHTVLVRGGKIARIGPSQAIRLPRHATRVAGRGRYLIPGLADMHVHLRSRTEMPLYVVNGVTTVLDLNGRPAHLRWLANMGSGRSSMPMPGKPMP